MLSSNQLLEPSAYELQDVALLDYLRARLARLDEIARLLLAEGWSVHHTLLGLAFEPSSGDEWDQGEATLTRLGIHEQHYAGPSQGPEEPMAAVDEFRTRLRYTLYRRDLRSLTNSANANPEEPARVIAELRRLERMYGRSSLRVRSDYELGMNNGKLSALRWVLGHDWDFLDC